MDRISNEYAAALFSLAKEEKREAEFLQALKTAEEIFRAEPEYAEILDSRSLASSLRASLVQKAFGENMPEYVVSFICLLCEKGHIGEFFDCVAEYEKMYKHFLSVCDVKITSAVPLTESEKAALVSKLEKSGNKTVSARYAVDPAILGGIIVESDDSVIDGSLRGKLGKVKEVIEK